MGDFLTAAGVVADFGFSALDQIANDGGKYGAIPEGFRAVTAGAVHAAVDFYTVSTFAEWGTALGTAMFPGAGTVAGLVVGAAVGLAVGVIFTDTPVSNVVNAVSDDAVNAVTTVTNVAGNAISAVANFFGW